jgi:hypothetical protein
VLESVSGLGREDKDIASLCIWIRKRRIVLESVPGLGSEEKDIASICLWIRKRREE